MFLLHEINLNIYIYYLFLGFLSQLSVKQLKILLKSLDDSYKTASNFDLRPGLKFLVQKVAQTNVASNLYKQAGVSWTIHMVVLFELCMSHSPLTSDYVKKKLYSTISKDLQNSKSMFFLLLKKILY